jgi:hypothetical protein
VAEFSATVWQPPAAPRLARSTRPADLDNSTWDDAKLTDGRLSIASGTEIYRNVAPVFSERGRRVNIVTNPHKGTFVELDPVLDVAGDFIPRDKLAAAILSPLRTRDPCIILGLVRHGLFAWFGSDLTVRHSTICKVEPSAWIWNEGAEFVAVNVLNGRRFRISDSHMHPT